MTHEQAEREATRLLKAMDDRAELDLRFGGDGDEGQALVDALVDLIVEGQVVILLTPKFES